jgi:glycosyltransferase involved in cell wall biosynthesis
MKILVFSDWFLPGTQAGGPTQSLLSLTQNVEASFYIVTRNTDHNSAKAYNLPTESWIAFSKNTHVFYIDERNVQSSIFQAIIEEIQPNWIYLNSLWSPLFTQLPLKIAKQCKIQSRVICAPRGMLKPEALKIKAWKKQIFLLLSKFRNTYSNIKWHATSEVEANEIRRYFGAHTSIHVAPNLASLENQAIVIKNKKVNQLNLLSVARVSSEKGILEAAEFLAHWNKPVEWKIAGIIQDLDLAKSVDSLLAGKQVKHEWLGHSERNQIRELYQWAHVFYLPTRGENFGHAIAEALSAGLPALISNATPWQNLAAHHAGFDLPLDKNEFLLALNYYWSMTSTELLEKGQCAQQFILNQANTANHKKQTNLLFFKD